MRLIIIDWGDFLEIFIFTGNNTRFDFLNQFIVLKLDFNSYSMINVCKSTTLRE